MTEPERNAIQQLALKVEGLAGQIAALVDTTNLRVKHLEDLCNERHGANKQAIEALSESDRTTYGFTERMKGMAVPLSALIAIAAVIVAAVR